MTLHSGTHLGPYAITAALGAGGMGEVYRAKDTKLGRDVALKILPASFTNDPERVARFRREAQVLASLNNPHIAQIHGLEEANGTQFLVLELVDGESLDKRIARGPIPVDEALGIAKQIAEALEAAHEKGIIHRDLKPANIALTKGGQVKVLDFGLAKAVETTNGSLEAMNSPTITSPALMTGVGVILGTAAYVSPEQARGTVVDKRTDIWAFGCVLYEMLSGCKPFDGVTLTDVVAAVMKNEPDWQALPPATSLAIRSLLHRCLKKDPAVRLHDIADARIEIQEAFANPAPVLIDVPHVGRTRTHVGALLMAAGVAVALTLAVQFIFQRPELSVSRFVTRLDLNLPAGVDLYAGNAPGVALSPDGRRVAFIGVSAALRQLYVRNLDRIDSVPLRGTDPTQTLFFSPDGTAIGFIQSDRLLKRVSLSDGLVVTLAHDADQYSGGTWASDGRITFSQNGALVQVAASGGPISQLTTPDRTKSEFHMWPTTVEGGKIVLFTSVIGNTDVRHIEALSTDTGRRRLVVDAAMFPLYAPTGHLMFFRDGGLIAAPFDARRLEVTGPPVRVVDDVGVDVLGSPLVALSSAGSLAYAPSGASRSRFVWVSRQGIEQPITDTPTRSQGGHLAPDGQRIALQMNGRLWLYDLTRATLARLTSPEFLGFSFPAWTPDGKRIVFRTRTGMRLFDVNGSGHSEPVMGSTGMQDIPTSVSPDGKMLAFIRQGGDTAGDIYVVSLSGDSPPRPVVNTSAYEGGAQFSPDGKWLAYVSDDSGQFQVYLRPFPGPERRWAVSTQGGSFPLWRRDGKELFYRNGNKMMAVDVSDTSPSEVTLSTPRVLFDQRYTFETLTSANYDVSPDGQRFLMVKDESGAGRLTMVLNWLEELRARLPTK
jgi:Tol biopolymer transport system component